MSLLLSRKEAKGYFLLVFDEFVWPFSKWRPGQPDGDGTAAYYSTDSTVLDANETKAGVAGVCVQEIIGEKLTLGKVSSCTLVNATQIEVEGRKYCAISTGLKTQTQSIADCKTLNARLPLPKSNAESNAFVQNFPNRTWIDITTDQVKGQRLSAL